MDYILSDDADVRYSDGEKRLFALIPKNGRRITTRALASSLHKKARNGRIRVVGTLSKLMIKTRDNKEPFKIRRDKRLGPYPVGVWLERLK